SKIAASLLYEKGGDRSVRIEQSDNQSLKLKVPDDLPFGRHYVKVSLDGNDAIFAGEIRVLESGPKIHRIVPSADMSKCFGTVYLTLRSSGIGYPRGIIR